MSTRWLRFGIALSGWRTLAPTVAAMIAMGVGNAPLRADVIELKMSVDEALTYVISMGSVSPTAHPAPVAPVAPKS